jgi:trigger factor
VVHSAVETVSPTRVRLTVEVPFAELEPELKEAYKTIGGQVRVQGFRPGRVPPAILDQRVGRGVVLEEAVQQALPRLYSEAVNDSGVAPVGRPEVDITELADREKLTFTAEVDVRPEIELPAYEGLSVTVEEAAASDADIDGQLDELRERFASLTPVERPAQTGDFLTLDLLAKVDGVEVPGGSATDLSYELGKDDLLDGLDDAVAGASAGETRTFTTTLLAGEFEGREADVEVTVKSVNERALPEVDDTFAEGVGFESAEALRDDVRTRTERRKRLEQGVDARDKVLEALLENVEVPLPPSVVEAEQEWRREQAQQQLAEAGLTIDLYLEREGKSEEEFADDVRQGAEQAVKAQLILDAIADKEQLDVNDAELTEQVVRRAQQAGVSPDQYAQQVVQSGQLAGLVSEVRRGKALATVMGAAAVTDTAGAAVDLEALRGDMGAAEPDDVQVDESGRRYHVHDDGTVHYLGE